jgi:hypothetical protein
MRLRPFCRTVCAEQGNSPHGFRVVNYIQQRCFAHTVQLQRDETARQFSVLSCISSNSSQLFFSTNTCASMPSYEAESTRPSNRRQRLKAQQFTHHLRHSIHRNALIKTNRLPVEFQNFLRRLHTGEYSQQSNVVKVAVRVDVS